MEIEVEVVALLRVQVWPRVFKGLLCLGGIPVLLNVLGIFRRGIFSGFTSPLLLCIKSLASFQNLFHGTFHNNHLSIMYPSIYPFTQQIFIEYPLCDRPWRYNSEQLATSVPSWGSTTPAVGISPFPDRYRSL